jgi:hypothetical protein
MCLCSKKNYTPWLLVPKENYIDRETAACRRS